MASLEERLYLATAGGRAAEATTRDLLRDGADFGRVVEMAVRDGVAGPFSRLIRGIGGVVLEPATIEQLIDLERAPEFRMRYLERRLGEALRTLDGRGFDVLVVGGAALGFTSYGFFGDMAVGEVQLLVKDVEVVEAVVGRLSDHGWTRQEERGVVVDAKAPAFDVRLRIGTELFADVHRPFALSAAEVWAAAEHRGLLPPRARVPGRLHRLLLTCIEFAWGRGLRAGRWRGLRDVAAILAEGPFEWDAFGALAEQTRSERYCYEVLKLARERADQPVPDEVLVRLRPVWWRRVLRV